ncbi:M23 family metallopeptidase [Solibacillus merdavium]|uniref:M23 family metallopeptidase n=1 Tax=Solibacillus merdavium TaxID=2762218 RepID=A0ABR8XN91_9BACL|nr:M23 family metallopeptidase [Solibacillus merdavium]MBD8033403.1 M23 family metallopeptidase [Solibacillus merdavium]
MNYQLKERFGEFFLQRNFKIIYENTSISFQELVSFEQFLELSSKFNNGVSQYTCIASNIICGLYRYIWVDDAQTKAVILVFDDKDVIQGLYLKPFETCPMSNQIRTKNKYMMPITDEWFVIWGGTNEFVNYHYPFEQQRYAYNLVKMVNHQTYKDAPLKNENYFAFGAEVVAPADGTVLKVMDSIIDNVPGEKDETNILGNYCIIVHENNEYSMIAHFKKDSICVNVGDSVKTGQLLGFCGNSGYSSEPHIHFQVMNHADFTQAKSLRINFYNGLDPVQRGFWKACSERFPGWQNDYK